MLFFLEGLTSLQLERIKNPYRLVLEIHRGLFEFMDHQLLVAVGVVVQETFSYLVIEEFMIACAHDSVIQRHNKTGPLYREDEILKQTRKLFL